MSWMNTLRTFAEDLGTLAENEPPTERVANPRIREDRAVQDFRQNSDKMHRATHATPSQEHALTIAEASSQNP